VLKTARIRGALTYEGLRGVLDKSSLRVFAIGVGETKKDFSLEDLGRAGTLRAPSLAASSVALDHMAAKVDAVYESFYLLSYCSPARDGRRLMKVEVLHHDSQGVARKGTLFDEIDAVGFGAGCVRLRPALWRRVRQRAGFSDALPTLPVTCCA
jgi:hypothetical protein